MNQICVDPSDRNPAKSLLRLFVATFTILSITLLSLEWVGAASSSVLINAIYYDTYLSGEPDEAFQLINLSAGPIDLTNISSIYNRGRMS